MALFEILIDLDAKEKQRMKRKELKSVQAYRKAHGDYLTAQADLMMDKDLLELKRQAEALNIKGLKQQITMGGYRFKELEDMMNSSDPKERQKARDVYIGYKGTESMRNELDMLRTQNAMNQTLISLFGQASMASSRDRENALSLMRTLGEHNLYFTDTLGLSKEEMKKYMMAPLDAESPITDMMSRVMTTLGPTASGKNMLENQFSKLEQMLQETNARIDALSKPVEGPQQRSQLRLPKAKPSPVGRPVSPKDLEIGTDAEGNTVELRDSRTGVAYPVIDGQVYMIMSDGSAKPVPLGRVREMLRVGAGLAEPSVVADKWLD